MARPRLLTENPAAALEGNQRPVEWLQRSDVAEILGGPGSARTRNQTVMSEDDSPENPEKSDA